MVYFAGDKSLNVEFVLLTGTERDESVLNYKGKKGKYSQDYDEYDNPEQAPGAIQEVEVDSDAMVRQVFADIQATETIDFTKPYARVIWFNHGVKDLPSQMTFYAQTAFPKIAE